MPVGAHTGLALGLAKARRRPNLPATTYAAARATSSPRRLSNRDWIIQSPLYPAGGARAITLGRLGLPAGEPTGQSHAAPPPHGSASSPLTSFQTNGSVPPSPR